MPMPYALPTANPEAFVRRLARVIRYHGIRATARQLGCPPNRIAAFCRDPGTRPFFEVVAINRALGGVTALTAPTIAPDDPNGLPPRLRGRPPALRRPADALLTNDLPVPSTTPPEPAAFRRTPGE